VDAENCYRKVLAIDPNHFDGLHLLGLVAHQVGRGASAAQLISQAIASHDRSSARRDLKGSRDAARAQQDLAAAHSNLSIVLNSLGDPAAALTAIQRSLQLYETENTKLLFVGCLRNLSFIPNGIDLRDDLARALSEPWGRPTDIARFAANLIKRDGTIGACVRRIGAAWPNLSWPDLSAQRELFSPAELAEICGDRLLRCLFESTIVFDLELEQFLTAVRRTMLAAVVADGDL
jgi:tetratricopeptide (TPR) repeat protein